LLAHKRRQHLADCGDRFANLAVQKPRRPSGCGVPQVVRVTALLVVTLLLGNRRSLAEGLRYLRDMLTWRPEAVQPLAPNGPFGVCYQLVRGDNATRYRVVSETLQEIGLTPLAIPVPDEPLPNLLVRFDQGGPYTLFVAHYDKSRVTPSYQGASDNTAAVSVLLAAAWDLVIQPPARSVALLFTAAEERGLKGAHAFLAWAQANDVPIAEVMNLDMLGRNRIATRPSALPGFYFWLPLIGEIVFDGRRLRRGTPYPQPDQQMVCRFKDLMGKDLVVYQRFTAYSDSNAFQAAGLPTVSLSSDNMYYLDVVWERDADRVEWLDERNLELARRLIVGYANEQAQRRSRQ
jgi:hypothetical protein